MPPPSTIRVRELVQHHWGPGGIDKIAIPPSCSLAADVCADTLSLLLARGLEPKQLDSACTRLFDECKTNTVLLSRAVTELYMLARCSPVARTQIALGLGFQATDSRPALAFCLKSICDAIDALPPSAHEPS